MREGSASAFDTHVDGCRPCLSLKGQIYHKGLCQWSYLRSSVVTPAAAEAQKKRCVVKCQVHPDTLPRDVKQ